MQSFTPQVRLMTYQETDKAELSKGEKLWQNSDSKHVELCMRITTLLIYFHEI
jgi:hypothetical protein